RLHFDLFSCPTRRSSDLSALQLGELTTPTQDDASRSTAQPSSEGGLEHRSLPPAETPVLELNQLRKEFGGLVAVNDLSFGIKTGDRKSTRLNSSYVSISY